MFGTKDCWDSKTHKQIAEYSNGMLWRFIQPNAKNSEIEEIFLNLTHVTKRDLFKLVDIRILLSKDTRELLTEIAPKIISRLVKMSVIEKITVRGQIHGRIDWQRTILSRYSEGGDPSLYVYAQRAQIFDLPENRLFLYIIKHLYEKARNCVSDDNNGLTWIDEPDKKTKWVVLVSSVASIATRILRNPYISKINNLYELDEKIIEQTKSCRQVHYKKLAEFAEKFMYSQKYPMDFLRKEQKNNVLEPLSKDTLFETAVLFKTIHTAKTCGWQEVTSGLVGGSTKCISILSKNNSKMRIYYQTLPILIAKTSVYGDLMSIYGLSDKLRRPDIIIEISTDQSNLYFIVEVKRSHNRKYLVDGTYKLLGYLKDFEKTNSETTRVQGILAVWGGIELVAPSPKNEVQILAWSNYEEGLSAILNGTI